MANALENQVLRLISENADSPDVYSDIQEIRDSINDAIAEINMLTGGYTSRYTIPLLIDTTFYRFTLQDHYFAFVIGCWDEQRRRRLDQTDLIKLNAHNSNWLEDSGPPERYLQIGHDIIGFWPRPSATSGVVTVECAVIPKPYDSDSDPIRLKHDYRWAVVNYAASEHFADIRQPNRAARHFSDYLQAVGTMVSTPRALDRVMRMQDQQVTRGSA